jgi:hypothetical protein
MALSDDSVKNIIKTLSEKSYKQNGQYTLFGNTYIYVRDPLPENVNIEEVVQFLYSKMPQHLFSEVDAVYVGNFEELQDRQIQAMYRDGAIYCTNLQSNEEDMIDDLVHEIAHSLEQPYGMELYSDGMMELEFIGKRRRLKDLLEANGFEVKHMDFSNPEYDEDFDMYLYQEIGYPILESITSGLFTNPYASTSLREYYASGFEQFILSNRELLKTISPILFAKIQEIVLDG